MIQSTNELWLNYSIAKIYSVKLIRTPNWNKNNINIIILLNPQNYFDIYFLVPIHVVFVNSYNFCSFLTFLSGFFFWTVLCFFFFRDLNSFNIQFTITDETEELPLESLSKFTIVGQIRYIFSSYIPS